ncbi:hypothetical protein GCM10023143_00800 [Compostibacter hankyongensis]|uniref:FecR family protein n=1 Tax=Compostibacter hankyongensis TaxID=1007089 RepID=A0ABP8FCG1_9BACT
MEQRLWERLREVVASEADAGGLPSAVSIKAQRRPRYRWAAAAAVLLCLLLPAGWWLWREQHVQPQIAMDAGNGDKERDIPPAAGYAVLTLADGSKVDLDDATAGTLTRQGKTTVSQQRGGQLVYRQDAGDMSTNAAIRYNVLSIPRGGQYRLTLPDGTRVWLNAASSLRYPVAFTGKERSVELNGEAYFEVEKKAGQPFHVKAGGADIAVLGTSFDVAAYRDEPVIKTTLIAGAVRVTGARASSLLAPRQQGQLTKRGDLLVKENADITDVLAWKEGLFRFNSADVSEVMRQLARWYDVEIAYADAVPAGHITGTLPRNTNLSEVLKVLKLNGIKVNVEGRVLTVQAE